MLGNNNCTSPYDGIFGINDSTYNCSNNSYYGGHYCFKFNHRGDNDNDGDNNGDNDNGDDDNNDHNFSNNDCENYESDNNNYIDGASDNDNDSIHALDDQLDAILYCFGSQYLEFSK